MDYKQAIFMSAINTHLHCNRLREVTKNTTDWDIVKTHAQPPTELWMLIFISEPLKGHPSDTIRLRGCLCGPSGLLRPTINCCCYFCPR